MGILTIFPIFVHATSEKQTSTTQVNEKTITWEYNLDESNNITDLKCNNPQDLPENVDIPEQIDNKTVISIGSNVFNRNSKIKEIKIPDSVI